MSLAGYKGGMHISRRKVIKPGEDLLGVQPPAHYNKQDLYIGAVLCLDGFPMRIVSADEYALRYMETHANEVGNL